MSTKPIIAITMGDPASIGPEIAIKALLNKKVYDNCCPVLVGDAVVFQDIIDRLGLNARINVIKDVKEAQFEYGTPDVLNLQLTDIKKLKLGEISAIAGNASFQCYSHRPY
jgi:4-phospho-D-threonate 3-dehydrogenase / 4-phospho-D-erythronate 3-dehydrogenase